MVGDAVVIPKGATALGTVTEAVPKRRMARGGEIEIVMDPVRLSDGQGPTCAVKEAKGGGHAGGMTVGIVATAIVFWPAPHFSCSCTGRTLHFRRALMSPTFIN